MNLILLPSLLSGVIVWVALFFRKRRRKKGNWIHWWRLFSSSRVWQRSQRVLKNRQEYIKKTTSSAERSENILHEKLLSYFPWKVAFLRPLIQRLLRHQHWLTEEEKKIHRLCNSVFEGKTVINVHLLSWNLFLHSVLFSFLVISSESLSISLFICSCLVLSSIYVSCCCYTRMYFCFLRPKRRERRRKEGLKKVSFLPSHPVFASILFLVWPPSSSSSHETISSIFSSSCVFSACFCSDSLYHLLFLVTLHHWMSFVFVDTGLLSLVSSSLTLDLGEKVTCITRGRHFYFVLHLPLLVHYKLYSRVSSGFSGNIWEDNSTGNLGSHEEEIYITNWSSRDKF